MMLSFLACKEKYTPLSHAKMSKILMELHIAESYAQFATKDSNQTSYKNEDTLLLYNAQILMNNKISEQEFQKSIDWYKVHPELLDSIYQKILSDIAILTSKHNK